MFLFNSKSAGESEAHKKHSLRAACHQKVLFRNSHKCILHTFAGNYDEKHEKKLNLTMSEDCPPWKADDIRCCAKRGRGPEDQHKKAAQTNCMEIKVNNSAYSTRRLARYAR
jgi:hypothetical protein